jgi:ribose transport system permease protein
MDLSSQKKRSIVARIFGHRFLSGVGLIPIATLVMCLLFVSMESRFGGLSNIQNIVFQAGVLALISFAQFFPLLSGGIDFSVGAQIGLASTVSSMLIMNKFHTGFSYILSQYRRG